MTLRTHCAAFAVASGLLFASTARADLTTSHQIPYQGHLDLDGTPMNGLFDFWFDLYPTPTGGDCSAGVSASCLWTDEVVGVDVTAGAFSVALGSNVSNPVDDDLWQNVDVYLGIRVKAESELTYTGLTGRQRILAVPMAARADTAKDYHVTGTLAVDGGTTIHALVPKYQSCCSQGNGDGGASIYNDGQAYKKLMLIGNNSAGGARQVGVWDDLTVYGKATTTGDLTAGGFVRGSMVTVIWNGGHYNSLPLDCVSACRNAGLRMSTTDEVFAWAAAGVDMCNYVWMLDQASTGHVCAGYGMYTSQATTGCGPAGTGNVPRMIDLNCGYTFSEGSRRLDCACSPVR